MLIRHTDGRLQGAVLLSMSEHGLRLAVPGYDDALALRLHPRGWRSDAGETVQIDFSSADPMTRIWLAPTGERLRIT